MRDDRYTRANGPYDVDDRGYADDQAYGYQSGYGEQQPSGFTRHQSSNSRKMAAENPVIGVVKRAGDAVSGFIRGLGSKGAAAAASRGARPSVARASVHDGGDYLGAGNPCRVCGNPVASNQMRCPHCGAFVTPFYRNIVFWIAAVALVALVVVLSIAISSCKSGDNPSPSADPTAISTEGDKSALSAVITSAKTTLEAQASAHTYTRYSLSNLKDVVTQAETVLSDATVTNERVATAAQQVSDAIGALAGVVTDYPWPSYNDLVVNTAAYVGQQVAVNGTCQLVNVHEDGSVSAALAMSGDPACVVYVDYTPSDADGALAVGLDFNAMGTIAGLAGDGTPYMVADTIDIL